MKSKLKFKLRDCECETCPLSWEDRGYEGDVDCGCYIYDDLYGNKALCHIPNFIKHIITKIKERQICDAQEN